MKIAAGIIVKNDEEAEQLNRCLNTVCPNVDAVFLTVTAKPYKKIEAIANRYGVNVDIRPDEFTTTISKKHINFLKKDFSQIIKEQYVPESKEGDQIFNFGRARQANLDFIPDEFEWFFWIDTDDVLRNGKELRNICDQAMQTGAEAVFFNYLYQVEFVNGQIKNVVIQHLRERLVRINGDYRKVYKWVGSVHETLIQQRETKKIEDQRLDVVHMSTNERRNSSLLRNIKTLELDTYETRGKDPRPIYYLGKTHYDFHSPEHRKLSKALIHTYLAPEGHERNMSGWSQERAQAWEYLGEMYREDQEINNSIKCFANAIIEEPQSRSIYLNLAISNMYKKNYDIARFWTILASKIPAAKTTLATNPRDEESRAYEVIYNVGLNTNRTDEAWAAMQRLVEMYPNDKNLQKQWQFINNTKKIRDVLKEYTSVANYLNAIGERSKLKTLLAAAPSTIADNPLLIKMQQELNPPRTHEDNEVTIYLGPQFTAWSPKALEDQGQSFIGGSEEATIYLSRELTKLGWKVTVFADPGPDEGEYDGVVWKPYYQFNPRDNFNILVYWRGVGNLAIGAKAKKTYIWCHDVQNPVEYTKERLDQITKIIVLSKAHRDNLPDVPDDKFLITSNGFYEHLPEVKPKNNPKWCIWTSSYDRGLEHLLEIWPDVIKEVPDAQLHVFYGWKLFEHFYRDNPERMAWLRKIQKMLNHKGITHHDRVSQVEMEKWYKKCGVFTYPSHFYEINCISAIKAQLWGCKPVTTDIGALKETVSKYGEKITGDIWEKEVKEKYKTVLINVLNTGQSKLDKDEMMKWARDKYSWQQIAKDFDNEFKGGENGRKLSMPSQPQPAVPNM